MVERILKAKDQPTLLRGLQYFLQEKVKTSDITSGKKQNKEFHGGRCHVWHYRWILKETEDDY